MTFLTLPCPSDPILLNLTLIITIFDELKYYKAPRYEYSDTAVGNELYHCHFGVDFQRFGDYLCLHHHSESIFVNEM